MATYLASSLGRVQHIQKNMTSVAPYCVSPNRGVRLFFGWPHVSLWLIDIAPLHSGSWLETVHLQLATNSYHL